MDLLVAADLILRSSGRRRALSIGCLTASDGDCGRAAIAGKRESCSSDQQRGLERVRSVSFCWLRMRLLSLELYRPDASSPAANPRLL